MQIFTFYQAGRPVDQQRIFGDALLPCPRGWVDTSADASIVALPPLPAVPTSVTNFQCRAVLMGMPSPSGVAGRTLFDDINDNLKARGGIAWQAWEFANEVDRAGPLVGSLIAMLGMTAAQADALFITASTVTA